MDLTWFIHLLQTAWTNLVITAGVLYLAWKYANTKLFEEGVKKARQINNDIEEAETNASQWKIRKIQKYLEDHKSELHEQGIDRCSLFLMHNWTRSGDFHYMYYSLVAEIQADWLETFANHKINMESIPFFTMINYEDKLKEWNGSRFSQDLTDLWPTATQIAKQLWTKSLYIRGIYDLDWDYIGIMFISSVFEPMEERPNCRKCTENVRALLLD